MENVGSPLYLYFDKNREGFETFVTLDSMRKLGNSTTQIIRIEIRVIPLSILTHIIDLFNRSTHAWAFMIGIHHYKSHIT